MAKFLISKELPDEQNIYEFRLGNPPIGKPKSKGAYNIINNWYNVISQRV